MVMSKKLVAISTTVALIVVGCGSPDDGAAPSTTVGPPSTVADSTTVPDHTSTTTGADLPADTDAIANAISHLTEHLSATASEVVVIEAKPVRWSDGSLGCPQEGQMYTQAIVDGAQVLLQVGDRIYDYRAGSDNQVVLCPSEEKDGGRDFVPPPGFDE